MEFSNYLDIMQIPLKRNGEEIGIDFYSKTGLKMLY